MPATFFDLGMRLEANPHLVRFALAEGHTVLGHSWDHPNLNSIPASVLAFEIADTAARFAALGAPYSANVIRPPFLSANAATTAALAAMGFTVTPGPIADHGLGPGALGAADRHGRAERPAPGRGDPAARRSRRLPRRARRRSTPSR